jgi:hypothetical protein
MVVREDSGSFCCSAEEASGGAVAAAGEVILPPTVFVAARSDRHFSTSYLAVPMTQIPFWSTLARSYSPLSVGWHPQFQQILTTFAIAERVAAPRQNLMATTRQGRASSLAAWTGPGIKVMNPGTARPRECAVQPTLRLE